MARKTRRSHFTSQVTALQAGQVHRSDWEKQRRDANPDGECDFGSVRLVD